MQSLLEAIRKSALPGTWSLGVKLARDGAVAVSPSPSSEVTARVRVAGLAVAPSVVLYPEDGEWACDCVSKVDPCAHVCAAAIALTQAAAAQPGEALAAAPRPHATLSYRFSRKGVTLAFERYLMRNGSEELLTESLASLVARGEPVTPTHEEMLLDRIIGGFRRGQFDPTRVGDVLALLENAADVRFDGRAVKASGERVEPRAVVEDERGGGVVLRIDRNADVTEVLAPGLARCGETLRALANTALTGASLERLPLSRRFAAEQLGELVTVVLPEIQKKLAVVVRSKRLPRTTKGDRPRVRMEYSQREHSLSVLPTLVYGDPPRARIDDGKLVHLSGTVPARDEAAERALVHRLRDELNLVFGRRVDFDGKQAAKFLARLESWSGELEDNGQEIFHKVPLAPKLSIDGDNFDLTFELAHDGDDVPSVQKADAASVLRAWQDGIGMVALEGGGFAPLPHDWLERYGHRVADLLAARSSEGRVATVALPALGELCDELGAPRPPGLQKLAPLIDGFAAIPEVTPPPGLTATLRVYQKQGVDWLCFLRDAQLGAVLADDMGLGKTLQMLCALQGHALVVCPKSVVHNWGDEIRRFRPDLRVSVYQGKNRKVDPQADVTLVTYAVLRIDADELAAHAWDVLVLDEAQAIKNSDSQVARASYQLPGKFRVALSGTPVENRLEELWSLMHFTNPGLLGSRSDFQERYASRIAVGNPEAAARLRTRIKPFLLRRVKREVAPELPPRTDVVLHCELDEDERSVYDAVRVATQKNILSKLATGGSVLAALEALLRLRQAACHSALIPGQHATTSAKVTRLLEALEEAAADGHKSLVFSQWTSLLDLVEPHLVAAGIGWTRLDGSTRDRGAVVAEFQSEGGPPVMLASLKAGGTGLNLTAADHVFLLDPWWNPAAEDQAADRAHRIGQDRPVMVYRLVAKDTVEEGILALQSRKRALSDVALGGADQAAALTRDDLLALLT